MKLFYTALFALTFSLSVNAQVKEQAAQKVTDSAYNAKYTKFKGLFLKYQLSDSHKKYKTLNDAFTAKLHADKDTKFDKQFTRLNYVKVNLTNTDFKSYDEAQKDMDAIADANVADFKDNKAYHDYMMELIGWGNLENTKIIEQAMRDVLSEIREKEGN
jgi:DNA-dependent RNA polymerase auxiliary subunit epsilon